MPQKAIVKCERTYEGGCLNWQKLLMEVFNGPFTVEDCYAQCSKYSDCAGFFIKKTGVDCQLFESGCQKRVDRTNNWDYYEIKK